MEEPNGKGVDGDGVFPKVSPRDAVESQDWNRGIGPVNQVDYLTEELVHNVASTYI